MSMKKQYKRHWHFTLVELMVALVVFVILLGLMLQFFSGAQKMWTSMEQRNNIYAGSRTALDLLSRLLQTHVHSEEIPFKMTEVTNSASGRPMATMFFLTRTPINLGGGDNSIRLVRFHVDSDHNLRIQVMHDGSNTSTGVVNNNTALEKFMRAYNTTVSGASAYSGLTAAANDMTAGLTYDVDEVVLSGVTGFDVNLLPTTTGTNEMPKAVEVRIYLMDKKNFDIWNGMSSGTGRTNFLRENERMFARVIFFDDITEKVQ